MIDHIQSESCRRAGRYLQEKENRRWTDRINKACLAAILSLVTFSLVLAVIAYV